MKVEEAKEKFIQTWGGLATSWGINRTMAMVHAFLLINEEAKSTDEIMDALQISRGNANMNLRELMDWGIVKKELKMGERKEFFTADKDIWNIFKQIVKERRKRELEPVMNSLQEYKNIDEKTKEAKEFTLLMDDLLNVTSKVNLLLELAIKSDENWLVNKIMKLVK